MGTTLLMAFALMLIVEGLLPFLAPNLWRETFRRLMQLSDGQIRFFGLTSMLAGVFLLFFFRLLDLPLRRPLPAAHGDSLPGGAARIGFLRRAILDLFFENKYELVMPPLVEFTDSLLTGTGHDLDLRTFKLVDQLSGRMMGVRADITPQVARIDAHLLNRPGVTRLCYCGSVLHARPASVRGTPGAVQDG